MIHWSDQLREPVMGAKISMPRVSDAVASELENRILEGSLKPGHRLAPERELAQELGVSRSSLREAIQKLVSRGMLESRQGEGTFVTSRLESGFLDPWEIMVDSHASVREDLLEFRHMLEARAAECASVRASEADRERLKKSFRILEVAFEHDDLDKQVEADLAFHQAIAEASHNAIIGHMTSSLLRLMRDHIRKNLSELMRLPAAREKLRAQHAAVLNGILEGQASDARRAATEHIDFVRQSLAEVLRQESRRDRPLRPSTS